MEEIEALVAARKLDAMMSRVREKQKERRLMANFREKTYQEYSLPLKVKRSVVMEDGRIEHEVMEILMCLQNLFGSMGLPFTMWHMPHRRNYTGFGLPVNNPEGARIVEALEQEKLNRLAWSTESLPFETLSAQMRGLKLENMAYPEPRDHMESPGVTDAKTAAPPGQGVVQDTDHDADHNLTSA
ncbi:hypothetical protein SARC_12849 [Sphaeroforma arctica JP610]|uniref:Uncharacterized protein n=1 Tax=Sphaeroforma arctica JP610 TaxID=667725 RepID=A0A0L0FEZ1_9EUKA|nr:hypothetical protein SARC_12849 [Sphaeroforma arctica JP610]KNC74608.1 hypothetical protein SARC_12849 [Sphaeroforma arctica JP610]|eukprot:XP_014148510.1 hypothetical protein SARC_12849 [Sphaeroforma arctica JP610]